MKANEIKQLKEALSVMRLCFTEGEVMAERAKEREEWNNILARLQKLEEPLEEQADVWANKEENLSDKQRETFKGEKIQQVARKYEDLVDNLKSMIYDIEYLLEEEI